MLDDKRFKVSETSLKARYQEHATVEQGYSCDSEYMLSTVNRVGEAIRQNLRWVPIDELIYLFIDRTGSPWTKETIIEYKK